MRRGFVAALLITVAVAACGFHLRGVRELPFESIFLNAGANSALSAELARNIRVGTSTKVVADRASAGAVLDIIGETRDREILSLNAQGRAAEYTLRYRLSFKVHDNKGHEFIPATEIAVKRDISFNDSEVLAKESEETLMYRDMQTDLVQQILRRLATVKLDATKS
jgi:LPS-assembly lipoprotein